MKKKIILISIITLLLLVGCELEKKSITSTDFTKVLGDSDYVLTNASKNFENYAQIKEVFLAQNKESTYQIEFYVLDSKESANSFYDNNKKVFESIEGVSTNTELEGNNYQSYKQTKGDKYSVISCVDNTCIYANVDKIYKKEVKEIIEKFDY